MKIDQMIPGKRYRVQFDDCCVQGFFTSTFVRYDRDEDGDPHTAVFEDARAETLWGNWEPTEVDVDSPG